MCTLDVHWQISLLDVDFIVFLTFSIFYWPNKKKSHCRIEVDVTDTNAHTHNSVSLNFMHAEGVHNTSLPDSSRLETKTNRTWICVASELTVSVSKPDRLQCENYTTYSRKELCVWVIFWLGIWNFQFSRKSYTTRENDNKDFMGK